MFDRNKIAILTGAGLLAIVATASAYGHVYGPAKELTYIKNAQGMQIKSMGTPNINAFLQDIVSSNDEKAPLTCGLFRLEKSAPLTYEYTYDEAKIILEGSMTVSDGKNTVTASKGDVLFFPKGSTITFTTEKEGLGFICGQRARDNT